MEAIIVMVTLTFMVLVLVLPILAFLNAGQARNRTQTLEAELDGLRHRLATLEAAVQKAASLGEQALSPLIRQATVPTTAKPAPQPTVKPAAQPAPQQPLAVPEVSTDVPPAHTEPQRSQPDPSPEPSPEPVSTKPVSTKPASTEATPEEPPLGLEALIGMTWATRVGAAVLLVGVAWFFKYAVDNAWIGPWGRVGLGGLVGASLLGGAELLRKSTHRLWTHVMSGVGLAILLVAAWAAHALYGLVPVGAAFGVVALIVALGGVLSHQRHSEPLMMVALGAGLANPVLLSSGQDRPLGLFGYLLVIALGALVAASDRRWRWVAAAATLGPPALFAGWYDRYFDPAGAYADWLTRSIPMGAVLAFAALLMWAAWRWHRPDEEAAENLKIRPLHGPLMVASTAVAHCGLTALLLDQPLISAYAMVPLAGLYTWSALRTRQVELVVVPLLLSFGVLTLIAGDLQAADRTAALAAGGAWLGVYVGALLIGQPRGKAASVWIQGLLSITGLMACGYAVMLMWPDRLDTLAGALLALSALGLALAVRLSAWTLGGGAVAITGGLLVLTHPEGPGGSASHTLLALHGVWVLLQISALTLAARRGLGAQTPAALTWLPAVGLVSLLLLDTGVEADAFRATVLLSGGLLWLLGGLWIRQGEHAHARVSSEAWMVVSLGLLATAVPFLVGGATLAVVWSALGVTAAGVGRVARLRTILFAALALIGLAAGHLFFFDLTSLEMARRAFTASLGAQGFWHPESLFWHPRALSLLAVALGLLGYARVIRGAQALEETARGRSATCLEVVGHGLVLVWCVSITWVALGLEIPVPGAGLPEAAFHTAMTQVFEAESALAPARRVALTLWMGGYGAALLTAGFVTRHVASRWLGLALLGLTVAKLALVDVWSLARIYQMIIMVVVGAMLLSSGFLYARFARGADGRV